MPSAKYWPPIPRRVFLIEILEKRKEIFDDELFRLLNKKVGTSWNQFNRLLLQMEIAGKIRVCKVDKTRRIVTLL